MNTMRMQQEEQLKLLGNASVYDAKWVEKNIKSPLNGKKMLFLGSSVTYGVDGVSFVEYLEQKDGVIADKEAISGTFLVDEESKFALVGFGNGDSYVKRLQKREKNPKGYDCFICQLSTNDASSGKPMGIVSQLKDLKVFDTKTVIGAIEYIISYVKKYLNCPIFFYTGCYYDNQMYADMVQSLYVLRDKWGIEIIDLYTDKEFNDISVKERELYMMDQIHPTRAGYLQWWLPKFEERLGEINL